MNTYELKIDYDGNSKKRLERRIWNCLNLLFFDVGIHTFKTRKSRKHLHAIVKIETSLKLTTSEIVALQAIMGSDYRRECFNFLRARHMDMDEFQERGNLLFSKNDKRFVVKLSKSKESKGGG